MMTLAPPHTPTRFEPAMLDPISLADLNRVAELQTRVDRKYIVDHAMLAAFVDAMAASHHQLAVDHRSAFAYTSIYLDTPDLATYRAAAQRRRHRYKVRTRTYEDTGTCMLEVKTKGRRGATVKHRMAYDTNDRWTLTDEGRRFFVGLVDDGDAVAPELSPVLTVEYRRSTLVDIERGTRVTYDTGLRCADLGGATASLDAVVVETKSPGRPSGADRWLWGQGVRPVRMSKFATGLALTRPGLSANRWHRALQQPWTVDR